MMESLPVCDEAGNFAGYRGFGVCRVLDSLAHLEGVRLVPDSETRAGVLTALYSGLEAASGELCLVVACDMPFLNGDPLGWQLHVRDRAFAILEAYRKATDVDEKGAVMLGDEMIDEASRKLAAVMYERGQVGGMKPSRD